MCWFHNWRELYRVEEYDFYGKICKKKIYTSRRICSKCHKVQWKSHDYDGGTAWNDNSKCEADRIRELVNFSDFTIDIPSPHIKPPKEE